MAKIDESKDFKIENKYKLKKIIIILLIILIIILAIISAISIYKWKTLALEMVHNESSKVFDIDGNLIAEIGNQRNRENIEFEKIPDNLKNAYISIEDERFYSHGGIDTKRTIAAIGSYIIHLGKTNFGGSTITQQLVKNMTGDDARSPLRKVNEWTRAIELEWFLSKDEILEKYLNIIYIGPNVYGVENGANYYFDKSVHELDLAECAFLAGINNSPNSYNPFSKEKDNSEKIKNRADVVLNKMLELGFITEDDCKNSKEEIENGLKFQNGKIATENEIYSYHTEALLNQVIEEISNSYKISKTFATNYLYMANLKIYSTQNSEIQSKIEKEFKKKQYILKSKKVENATSQSAMVIIDHKTGNIVGCVGGLGEKKENRGFNRATMAFRQTGSSSKTIAVIAPAIAEKIITPITTYTDEKTIFIDNSGENYEPTDYNEYLGRITVRRAVESSQNIPFVKIMEQLTPAKSIEYLKKMGITSLSDRDENLALALGGLDKGITPLEMAGAYSTIANNGTYIEPTFYSKITTNSGNIVLEKSQKKKKVFSEATCFITKKLLTQPVLGQNGTATYCKILGMDVAAKTGTTNDNFDRWLCGFTNYYTAVTWFGYDLNETIDYGNKNPAGIIWADVMNNIHKDLENSKFDMPKTGVIEKEICATSGEVANNGCQNTFKEYFISGTVPNVCKIHNGLELEDILDIDDETKESIKNIIKDGIQEIKEIY